MTHKIDEISSLSTAEFINLVGTYTALTSGKSDFDPELINKGYSPEALAEARKLTEKKFKPFETVGLRFTKPLDNFKSDILGYSWTLFENYERGLLPFPGTVSEQPAQIMEIFGVFQALKTENQIKHNKKIEAEAKRSQARRKK